jgi:bifunctional DNA-binding transcriptional regulator/antitoxin component of YhaV-PrlF toxin-antitoxin module
MAETSTMSSKGQVVVPKRVREALQANSGARIGFELKGDRALMFVIRKKTAKPGDGYGLLKGSGRTVALENWDAELGTALRREHARR